MANQESGGVWGDPFGLTPLGPSREIGFALLRVTLLRISPTVGFVVG